MRRSLIACFIAGAIVAAGAHGALARESAATACFKAKKLKVIVKGRHVTKTVKVRVACPAPAKPVPPPPAAGSARTSPFPFGSAGASGSGYTVAISSVNTDAWPVVEAENMFNTPPAPGNVDVLIGVAVTYTGADKGSAGEVGFAMRAVGSRNIGYSTFDDDCGVIPNELSYTDVFTGAQFAGNICFQVPKDDAASLVLYWDNSTPGPWWAIR